MIPSLSPRASLVFGLTFLTVAAGLVLEFFKSQSRQAIRSHASGSPLIGLAWASPHYPEVLWALGGLSRYHPDIARCVSCHEPFREPTSQQHLLFHTLEVFRSRSEPDVRQLLSGPELAGRMGMMSIFSCLDRGDMFCWRLR